MSELIEKAIQMFEFCNTDFILQLDNKEIPNRYKLIDFLCKEVDTNTRIHNIDEAEQFKIVYAFLVDIICREDNRMYKEVFEDLITKFEQNQSSFDEYKYLPHQVIHFLNLNSKIPQAVRDWNNCKDTGTTQEKFAITYSLDSFIETLTKLLNDIQVIEDNNYWNKEETLTLLNEQLSYAIEDKMYVYGHTVKPSERTVKILTVM